MLMECLSLGSGVVEVLRRCPSSQINPFLPVQFAACTIYALPNELYLRIWTASSS